MKRYVAMICAVVLLLSLALPQAAAADATSGRMGTSGVYWKFNSSTGLLTIYGTGDMPEPVDHNISAPWYSFRFKIKTVKIESGVTSICDHAFHGHENLKSITIPDTVKSIGHNAFYWCKSLASVRLPSKLKTLGINAFASCDSLTSIDIPGSVRAVGSSFLHCESLKTVTLHEGLEILGAQALRGLKISSITLPSTLKKIGKEAFYGCEELKSVVIREGLEEIEYRAFEGTKSLTSIVLPASLKYVWEDAFDFSYFQSVIIKSRDINPTDLIKGGILSGGPVIYGYSGSTIHKYFDSHPGTHFVPLYFEDVMPGPWYFDAVRYAKEHNLFSGTSDTRFSPNDSMTRAMAVTVLWRYAGSPSGFSQDFTDVPAGKWYSDAVAWAFENQIVNGVSDQQFDPNGNLTREQLATILYRFAQWQGEDTETLGSLDSFPDKDRVSNWARTALSWAVGKGIIGGSAVNGVDYLQARSVCTRAQVAAIMMRYIEQVRGESHPSLTICVEPGLAELLQPLVDTYAQAHEDVAVQLSECSASGFLRDYRLDWSRDLYLAVSESSLSTLQINSRHPLSALTPVASDPFALAVAPGNPMAFADTSAVLAHILAEPGRYALTGNTLYEFGAAILQAAGVNTNTTSCVYLDDSPAIAAAIADGTVDAGALLLRDALAQNLTVFPNPELPAEVPTGLTIYAAQLQDASHAKAAADFVAWLQELAASGGLAEYGLEPAD